MRTRLAQITGVGAASLVALALLAFGCVFAATAGPREALSTRTQALRQTLDGTSQLARAIVVSSTWDGVSSALAEANFTGQPAINITQAQLGEVTGQLHGEFNHGVVKLASPSQDWAGMTSQPHGVTTSLPAAHGVAVRIEVGYRDPFSQHMRLVAGSYPGTLPPPSAPGSGPARGRPRATQNLQVVVSEQTARQFGLHVGSKLKITGPQLAVSGKLSPITLAVTGIVAAQDPGTTFWTADPTALIPSLQTPQNAPPYWVAQVIAGPGEIDAVQNDFGVEGIAIQWEFPLDVSSLTGDQAQPLYDALNKLSSQTPPLSGDVAPISNTLSVGNGLLQPLGVFIATAQSVDTLLWLLYVSLAVAGLVTLLLAARMVAMRRSAELAMRRARGASLAQIAATTSRGAAIACVPAAVLAAALAVLVVPGPVPAGGWWPPVVTLLIAVLAPALVAIWQQRLPRRRTRDRRRPRGRARLVVEVTACLAAIAGVVVFRQQGAQPGSGVNLYTSAAPVLVAVPAVIIVLRVYPLVLRGLLRGSARRASATAFLGLARAARTALTPALPAFALVLALTVAAFAGMVRDAVSNGETDASWQTAGADVSIAASNQDAVGVALTPAAIRAATGMPGVRHATQVWQAPWSTADGGQFTGVVVDPASYAALVATTRTFPAVQAGLLAAGSPQPVLASPQAAAELGAGVTTITSPGNAAPIRVRVAGVLSGTPALPGATAFVIIPVSAFRSTASPPAGVPYNELLLTGASIDTSRLPTVMHELVAGGAATVRSDILNGLTGAPLQHGAYVFFALALAAAAVLGLAVLLLELALGAAEREATLARLATMGLGEGQRARVLALEVAPAVLAAAVAAGACAVIVPRLVAPGLDLSVFTGPGSGAPGFGGPGFGGVVLAPDAASFLVPLAGLAVAAFVALSVQIRTGRRRGVAARLRTGD